MMMTMMMMMIVDGFQLSVVFLLFRFLNSNDEVFSTEPVKNVGGGGTTLSFYHAQNVRGHVTMFMHSPDVSIGSKTYYRILHIPT